MPGIADIIKVLETPLAEGSSPNAIARQVLEILKAAGSEALAKELGQQARLGTTVTAFARAAFIGECGPAKAGERQVRVYLFFLPFFPFPQIPTLLLQRRA